MKAFSENDVAVLPFHHVFTEGIGNFTGISFLIKYFKEEIVPVYVLYHEWISNETGFYICDIFCAYYRVCDAFRGEEVNG